MNTQDVEGVAAPGDWGKDPLRAPDVREGDRILFSEHGRIVENVDHRSHYFRLVQRETFQFILMVKHGGGQEEIDNYSIRKLVTPLKALDSDARYLLMYAVHSAWREGQIIGRNKTAETYRAAFIEGRLKKRKMPNRNTVKVWIEPRPYNPAAPS
jgi:hypothetical protein